MMSKATYDKLTHEQKQIVLEVGRSLQKFARDACKADDEKVAKVYGKAGDKVLDMSEQQFMQWKALAEKSAWKSFADHVKDGKKLLEMAQAVK